MIYILSYYIYILRQYIENISTHYACCISEEGSWLSPQEADDNSWVHARLQDPDDRASSFLMVETDETQAGPLT